MSGPRILTLGRSGQLAQSLAMAAMRLCAIQPLALICLGRPDVDLARPDTLSRALDRIQPDLIINAAAYTHVDGAETHRDEAMALNRDGPAALARRANQAGIPLIHLST